MSAPTVKKCSACKGKGWLLMAGGFAIRGTAQEFAAILKSIKNETSSRSCIGMEVQKCDACDRFESDEAAQEKAMLLFSVRIEVLFELTGGVNSTDLVLSLNENTMQAIDVAVHNDTDFIELVDEVKIVSVRTEGDSAE